MRENLSWIERNKKGKVKGWSESESQEGI